VLVSLDDVEIPAHDASVLQQLADHGNRCSEASEELGNGKRRAAFKRTRDCVTDAVGDALSVATGSRPRTNLNGPARIVNQPASRQKRVAVTVLSIPVRV
jgi:hypothetical protein